MDRIPSSPTPTDHMHNKMWRFLIYQFLPPNHNLKSSPWPSETSTQSICEIFTFFSLTKWMEIQEGSIPALEVHWVKPPCKRDMETCFLVVLQIIDLGEVFSLCFLAGKGHSEENCRKCVCHFNSTYRGNCVNVSSPSSPPFPSSLHPPATLPAPFLFCLFQFYR